MLYSSAPALGQAVRVIYKYAWREAMYWDKKGNKRMYEGVLNDPIPGKCVSGEGMVPNKDLLASCRAHRA